MVVPEVFSFVRDPATALYTLRDFAAHALDGATRQIIVDQYRCKDLGYGAEVVLSALALEAQERFRISYNGFFPKDQEVKDIIRASGMPRTLGFTPGAVEGFTQLSLLRGRKTPRPGRRSTAKDVVATRCIEYLDECLRLYEFELTPDGADLLGQLLGEILTNAEDHGQANEWWIAGYLRQVPGKKYGECRIVIFNVGETIYQSLQRLPGDAALRQQIEALVAHHTRRSLFRRGTWTPESLWTVYAMQGGVSRFHAKAELGHRGTGTVRMMEFFLELGQSLDAPRPPLMTIISGGTKLMFDGTYPMQDQETPSGQSRKVLAFNSENDLSLAPDPAYVGRFAGFFPGTLVSLEFYLDPRHLSKVGDQ